jgi:phosphoglycolate phosphatase-like HAD superfamily hydrolase
MDAVIFDMDGTLCDVEAIRHYVTGTRRNFDAFHRASLFCPPRATIAAAARAYARSDAAVVIVTARDARYERVTRDWLTKHGVPFDALYMRPWGDSRRDTVVKDEILAAILDDGYRPVVAFEDRADVAAVWESHGIRVFYCPTETAPA